MSWRLGIAAPMLVAALGCATARQAPSPAPTASTSITAATLETIAGEYVLVAIDGHKLPYPSVNAGNAERSTSWPVLAGALSLHPNGTFHMETTYNTDPPGTEKSSYKFTGTCFGGGSEFTMVWDGGGQTALAVRGDTVVLKNEGRAFAYVRS